MALLNKIDIIEIAYDLSENIPDRFIDPCVKKAMDIDLFNVLPKALVLAIKVLNTAEAAQPQLRAFYADFVRPCWAYYAYARFMSTHGSNVTQFGLVRQLDQDTEPVENADRGIIVKGILNDADVYSTRMRNELKRVNYTFDNTSYAPETNEVLVRPNKQLIRAIK